MSKHSPAQLIRSILLLGLALGPLGSATAQVEDPQAEFTAAYAAYQAAMGAGDFASALSAAKNAYALGQAYFGRVNPNTAALALNYGNLLLREDPGAAVEILSEADRIYEELRGTDSLDRVETLLALAEAHRQYEDKQASVSAAVAIYRATAFEDKHGYAQLLFSAGAMLAAARAGSPDAQVLLQEALEVLEGEFGKKSPELIPTLVELGKLTRIGSREQLGYYRRASEIGDSSLGAVLAADVKLRIGLELVQQPVFRETVDYLTRAHRTYERRLGKEHPKTALAALGLAEAHFGVGQTKRAQRYLEDALEFYTNDSTDDRSNLLRARRLLMAIHLDNGEEALFDEQLMEVGRLSEGFVAPENLIPVVKYAPIYPQRAAQAQAEGYVVLKFTVNETGHVEDPLVVESGSKTGRGEWFHEAAIEAALKFRYIPRYVDGVPTSTPGIRNRITFMMD